MNILARPISKPIILFFLVLTFHPLEEKSYVLAIVFYCECFLSLCLFFLAQRLVFLFKLAFIV